MTGRRLATVRAKVSGNTAQWQSFKANLDNNLSVLLQTTYQADLLTLLLLIWSSSTRHTLLGAPSELSISR